MIRKSIAFVCLFSGVAACTPAFSQVVRQAEQKTEYLDQNGNVVGTSFFSVQTVENSHEAQKEALKAKLLNEKIAIFTNHIGLTSRESERFWPIYNQYSETRDELSVRAKKILRQLSNEQTMSAITEKEITALLDSYMICVEKDAQVQMEYYKKFLTVLSARKVAKVYQAEDKFRDYLLRVYRYGY